MCPLFVRVKAAWASGICAVTKMKCRRFVPPVGHVMPPILIR